jgi:hypothetical protein
MYLAPVFSTYRLSGGKDCGHASHPSIAVMSNKIGTAMRILPPVSQLLSTPAVLQLEVEAALVWYCIR